MSRILIIGLNKQNLVSEAIKRNWPDTQMRKVRSSGQPRVEFGNTTYYLRTPEQFEQIAGYVWDRIDVTEQAKEHPQFEEFIAHATASLAKIPADTKPTVHRWNTIDTARHNAAIEVAEAYRAISALDQETGPTNEQVDRLVNAAAAWEKIR